jgi:hypothetical protein
MTYSAADFVADQLRAAAPAAEWGMSGHDRSRELAQILVRAGVFDLGLLRLVLVEESIKPNEWQPPVKTQHYALTYDGGPIFGFLGTPDRKDNEKFLQGISVAWSAVGKGNVTYSLVPAPNGFAIIPQWASSSDWGKFRAVVKIAGIAASFALPMAGVAVANTIGAAIIGPSLAASYPALATIVGNTALSAAFNGGDIKKAVTAAVLGSAVGQVGGFVGTQAASASGVELIGKVADSATRALITGKDVEKAILTTIAVNGGDILEIYQADQMAPATWGEVFSADSLPADVWGFGAPTSVSVWNFPAPAFDMAPPDFGMSPAPAWEAPPADVWGFPAPALDTAPAVQPRPAPVEAPQAPRTDNFAFTKDTVNAISAAAMSALQLVKAYRNLDSPQVLTQARAQTPQGAVSALDTGIVQTRTLDGKIVNTRPPVGVAQSTVTGSIIVNNGDGTYTLIGRDGSRRVIQYGNESSGFDLGSISPAVWIAGAGLAFTLLRG